MQAGINSTTFKIVLDKNFGREATLKDQVEQRRLKVTSEPIEIYGKWYHRLLNKLTFGYRFKGGWTHEVESIPYVANYGVFCKH